MVTEVDILARWEKVSGDEEKLLFIVGAPGAGKSRLIRGLALEDGWKYIEAKDLLDEEFVEYARDMRPGLAPSAVCSALKNCGAKVVLVDNVEVLFAPILNLKPFELLKDISKQFPLIVGWRGTFDGERIYLEHNGNKHYASYDVEYIDHIITI